MIYLINKYHKVETGETAEAIKIEHADPQTAYEKALSKFYELCKNYTDDKSVLEWRVKIISAFDMTEKKSDGFAR